MAVFIIQIEKKQEQQLFCFVLSAVVGCSSFSCELYSLFVNFYAICLQFHSCHGSLSLEQIFVNCHLLYKNLQTSDIVNRLAST